MIRLLLVHLGFLSGLENDALFLGEHFQLKPDDPSSSEFKWLSYVV